MNPDPPDDDAFASFDPGWDEPESLDDDADTAPQRTASRSRGQTESGSGAGLGSRLAGMFRRPEARVAPDRYPDTTSQDFEDESWYEDEQPAAEPAPRVSRPSTSSRRSRPVVRAPEPRDVEPRRADDSFEGARQPEIESYPVGDDPTSPIAWDDLYDDLPGAESGNDWDDILEDEPPPPARRPAPRRTTVRSRQRTQVGLSGLSGLRMPARMATAELTKDRIAVALLGANLLSVLLMVLVLALAQNGLPGTLVMHLDAAGVPDQWGPPRLLWRIPLLCFAITLINTVIAWFLAPIERFGSRFMIAAVLLVQVLAWIALFDFI